MYFEDMSLNGTDYYCCKIMKQLKPHGVMWKQAKQVYNVIATNVVHF